MILVCGIPSEPPLAMLLRELEALGAPHCVLNQRLFDGCSLELDVVDGRVGGVLDLGGELVDLTRVQAVYARLMDEADLPELQGEPEDSPRWNSCRELHARLLEWLEVTPALVATRAGPNASNGSKTYQAQLALAHGFLLPETVVTNDPDVARACATEAGPVVYKSISGTRSIVTELLDGDLARLDSIRWCPVQFQRVVEGLDVRVHVVGEQVLATIVASAAVDYRYGDADLTAVELSPQLASRCVNLAQTLGLPFAGLDLRITPEDDVYCFEVNPSPAYSYYQAGTGQPIARALALLLSSARPLT